MANRKKRLAREQARWQKNLKFKEHLRVHKKTEAKGIVGIFEQMKKVNFRWELLPKEIKSRYDFPHHNGTIALREIFHSKRPCKHPYGNRFWSKRLQMRDLWKIFHSERLSAPPYGNTFILKRFQMWDLMEFYYSGRKFEQPHGSTFWTTLF